MKRFLSNKKELFWLIGTFLCSIVLNLGIFGSDLFDKNTTFDINIHDTYFVFAYMHIAICVCVLLFFTIYLIKILKNRFNNIFSNSVFIISTILFILIINIIRGLLNSFNLNISGSSENTVET